MHIINIIIFNNRNKNTEYIYMVIYFFNFPIFLMYKNKLIITMCKINLCRILHMVYKIQYTKFGVRLQKKKKNIRFAGDWMKKNEIYTVQK